MDGRAQAMELLASIEAGDRSADVLNFVRSSITDDDLTQIAAAIGNRTGIKLMLEGNIISNKSASTLAGLLAANVLETLVLAHNNMTSSGVAEMAAGLGGNTSLAELDLTYLKVGDDGVKALADAIATHPRLRVLKLYKCQLGDDGVHALVTALGNSNRSVRILDLGANRFGSDVVAGVAYALSANVISSIGLVNNDLRPADIEVLAECLEANTALRQLDLRKNKLADSGAEILAQILRVNTSLVSIDLRSNMIGERGFKAMADVLQTTNTTLRFIDLAGNKQGEFEGDELAQYTTTIDSHVAKNALFLERATADDKSGDESSGQIGELSAQLKQAEAALVAKSRLVDEVVANVGADNARVKQAAAESIASARAIVTRASAAADLAAQNLAAEVQRAHDRVDVARSGAERQAAELKRRIAALEMQVKLSESAGAGLAASALAKPTPTAAPVDTGADQAWQVFATGFIGGVVAVSAIIASGLLRSSRR